MHEVARLIHLVSELEFRHQIGKQGLPEDEPTSFEVALISFLEEEFGEQWDFSWEELLETGELVTLVDNSYSEETGEYTTEFFSEYFEEKFGEKWRDKLETDIKDILEELWDAATTTATEYADEDPDDVTPDEREEEGLPILLVFSLLAISVGAVEQVIIPQIEKFLEEAKKSLLSKDELVKLLQNELPAPVGVRASTYYDMLATVVINRTRNIGRLLRWNNLGIETLVWMTAGDDRVCPRCIAMEDREFQTSDLVGLADNYFSATSPEEEAAALPWPSEGETGFKFPDGEEVPYTAPTEKLVEKGVGIPPLHPNGRCWLELVR